jgi:serine/threonine protein kinase
MNRQDNLLYLCDIGYTHGRFLPILDGLIIAIQICNILETAHARNIIYRDHKILHYYWQENQNGVFMIDWNIAKRFPTGLSDTDTQFDLVQFGARALHYIFAGRPAPGALPLGPNRPDEIEAASRVYAAQWTYDDQRLPKDIKTLLEAVLSGSYTTARQLRDALQMIYNRFVELAR